MARERVITLREITNARRLRDGMVLTLSCGHERWLGGETRKPAEFVHQFRECVDGPCYIPFDSMGSEA